MIAFVVAVALLPGHHDATWKAIITARQPAFYVVVGGDGPARPWHYYAWATGNERRHR